MLTVRGSRNSIQDGLLHLPEVIFVDRAPEQPQKERPQGSLEWSLQELPWIFWTYYPELDGAGQVNGLKEFAPDTVYIDLGGQIKLSTLADGTVTAHATDMATILVGKAYSLFTGRGIAPSATISAGSLARVLPDPLS